MTQALSEKSQEQWEGLARSVKEGASHPMDRELLNQFLIGIHRRGEELSAHDLKTLVDDLGVAPELARDIMAFVEPALALLEAYDRSHAGPADDDEDDDVVYVGDDEVGPGILVM